MERDGAAPGSGSSGREFTEYDPYLRPIRTVEVEGVTVEQRIKPIPLCTVCKLAHFHHYELFRAMNECALPEMANPNHGHKKLWEWGFGLYALRQLKLIEDEVVNPLSAVGVASGAELFQFILTNYITEVLATDRYRGDIHFRGEGCIEFPGVNISNMIKDPATAMVAPVPWVPERLRAIRSDATNLREVETDSFDIAYSFSSIEHFHPLRHGHTPHMGAISAMKAMARVVKPGGIAIISTEWNLANDKSDPEFFNQRQVMEELVESSTLRPVCDIDWEIEPHLREPENWNVTSEEVRRIYEDYAAHRISDEEYKKIAASNFGGRRKEVGHNVVALTPQGPRAVPYGSVFLTMRNEK